MKKIELLERIEGLERNCNNLRTDYEMLGKAFLRHIELDIINLERRTSILSDTQNTQRITQASPLDLK